MTQYVRILCVLLACLFFTSKAYPRDTVENLQARVLISPLIVTGKLHVPVAALMQWDAKSADDGIQIGITDVHFAKGAAPTQLSSFIWYETSQDDGSVSRKDLATLDGKRVIVFLSYVRYSKFDPGNYYLNQTNDPTPFNAHQLDLLKSEIKRQAALNLAVDAYMANKHLPHYLYVNFLTNLLEHSWTASFANYWILHLNCSYVPALAKRMDDRSAVAFGRKRSFVIPNRSSGAWEAYRQYRPETVVDALDAVLNDITGAPGGDIMNGASEYQRQQSVLFWRTYVGLYFSNHDISPRGHFKITGPSSQACKGLR